MTIFEIFFVQRAATWCFSPNNERRSLVKAKLTHCKYSIWCCIIITTGDKESLPVDLNQAQNDLSDKSGMQNYLTFLFQATVQIALLVLLLILLQNIEECARNLSFWLKKKKAARLRFFFCCFASFRAG